MKCVIENCGKEAEFIIDGQSVCNDHRESNDEEPQQGSEEQSMGDKMTYGDPKNPAM